MSSPYHVVFSRLTVAAFAAVVAACSEVTDPRTDLEAGEVVVTTRGDEILLVAPPLRRVAARVPLGGRLDGITVPPEGSTAFATIGGARHELVAVDIRTAAILWRLPLSAPIDGVSFGRLEVLGASADGTRLFSWPAVRGGVVGIASLDVATRRVLGFSGPWNVVGGGIVALPGSGSPDDNRLIVVARPAGGCNGSSRCARVYFLDADELSLVDSIVPLIPGSGAQEDVWQAIPSPDGRSLYVAGEARIARYNVASRQLEVSIPRASPGGISVTADGSTVVLGDVGIWPDFPGSGLVRLYTAELDSKGTVDVSTPLGGQPNGPTATVTSLSASSLDGRTVYIRSGTGSVGPLYPIQPSRLLAIDVVRREFMSALELGGYNGGYVAVR